MLSLFPYLLDYGVIAVTTLRIVIALFFIFEGYELMQKRKNWHDAVFSSTSLLGGLALLLGFFTQAAAILLSIISIKFLYSSYKNNTDFISKRYYFLLLVLAASFLFLGPGIFGFDYPL